ncbi:MAG: Hpt domain-containing protein [Hyphomonadaceae bacterium]|nr:Hpt domain-containing protein [Hyphomonadaceae bacterium]
MGAGGDPAARAKQAHFLKSMALSSGAPQLAAVCEDIEHEGKAATCPKPAPGWPRSARCLKRPAMS